MVDNILYNDNNNWYMTDIRWRIIDDNYIIINDRWKN